MEIELMIGNESGTKVYFPAVEEGIEWTTQRRGAPGKLIFKVLQDEVLDFSEGSAVRLKVDGKGIFFGFVFSRKRDKENIVAVTAYDQIRYLKNKDTRVYENRTASQFVRAAAADFSLRAGDIEDTRYVIPSRVEENTSLLEMIENALDLTLQNTGEMYVLYDQYGFLTLKNIQNMKLDLLICHRTAEDYDYSVSIDGDTCNQIKLYQEDKEAGKRRIYLAKDTGNINQWGVLQYYEQVEEGENGQAKADALLALYNQKTRKLSVKNALGDIRVRPGCLLPVQLDLGEEQINHYMLIEKASHRFENGFHTMDLTLRGGGFLA